jgi:hypothetical protein
MEKKEMRKMSINVSSEKRAYLKFIAAGMTPAGACGLIGNLEAESDGFYTNRVEYLCIKRLKENGKTYTDETYTADVDSGKISCEDFLHPLPGKQYGYGLCQWTSPGRKAGLYTLAKEKNVSIADEDMQYEYLLSELENNYSSVMKVLKTATSIRTASDSVLKKFEIPADTGETVCVSRAARGQKFYDDYVATGKVSAEKEEEESMATEIEKIYAVAKEEVGYLEKATNAYLDDKTKNAGYNNYTKYWRDTRMEGLMAQYGYPASSDFAGGADWPYCADGVFWAFMKALGKSRALELLLHSGAAFINCETMYQKAVSAKKLVTAPQAGAVVLFYNSKNVHYHTEFCYAVKNGIMYTIGWNTSGASSVIANGGGVCDKRYVIANTAAHYFMPAYKESTATITVATGVSVTLLKYGSTGSAVKDMQTKLIALGYSCGSCGADGDFGSGTLSAVKAFQTAQGLTVDGIYGENTARALNVAYEAHENSQSSDPTNAERLFVGKIKNDGVDVRTWAGREYGNIKSWPKLNAGNLVDVLDYTQTATDGEKWYFVRIAAKYHGFVQKKNVEKA